MRAIIFFMIFLLLVSAVSAEKIKVGGHNIEYDELFEGDSDFDGINDRTSYYLDDNLVFASFDTDKDGKPDMWFRYTEGVYKDLAMRDSSGNGRPNNILEYDKQGGITNEIEKGFRLPGFLSNKGIMYGLIILAVLIFIIYLVKTKKKTKAKKTHSKHKHKKK